MPKTHHSSGFTLVELAIVMIIIGLLIGGVLKGQELVNNARVTTTINLIKSTEAAALGFKDRYNFMPGDVSGLKIPGCGAIACGGDENGAVGTDPTGRNDAGGLNIWWVTRMLPSDNFGKETYLFWQHLALAGFIKGVNSTADIVNDAEWGVTHPATPFGGGAEFFMDGFTTIGFSGHLIRLSRNGVGNDAARNNVEGNLTPSQAASIDRKMDDGNPSQGSVLANYGTNDDDCKTFDVYDEANDDGLCMLFFPLFR